MTHWRKQISLLIILDDCFAATVGAGSGVCRSPGAEEVTIFPGSHSFILEMIAAMQYLTGPFTAAMLSSKLHHEKYRIEQVAGHPPYLNPMGY